MSPNKTHWHFCTTCQTKYCAIKKRSCQNQAKHYVSMLSESDHHIKRYYLFVYLGLPYHCHHSSGSTNNMSQNISKKNPNKYFTLFYYKFCSPKIVWHKYLMGVHMHDVMTHALFFYFTSGSPGLNIYCTVWRKCFWVTYICCNSNSVLPLHSFPKPEEM